MSNSKVRDEGNIENKSSSTEQVDPKTTLSLTLTPNTANLGPQKLKKNQELE